MNNEKEEDMKKNKSMILSHWESMNCKYRFGEKSNYRTEIVLSWSGKIRYMVCHITKPPSIRKWLLGRRIYTCAIVQREDQDYEPGEVIIQPIAPYLHFDLFSTIGKRRYTMYHQPAKTNGKSIDFMIVLTRLGDEMGNTGTLWE